MLRALIHLSLLLLPLAGCAGIAPTREMTTGAVTVIDQEGEVRSDGWQLGERLVPRRDRGELAPLEAYRYGTAPGGGFYTIRPDGTGSLRLDAGLLEPAWSLDCSKDAMIDRRDCHLVSPNGEIGVYYGGGKLAWVCIAGHDFPGRKGAIRIDGGKPIETISKGCVDGNVAKQLARAKDVVTRSVKWPYDVPRDNHLSMRGLADAMGLADYIHANIDRLSFAARSVPFIQESAGATARQ
jgi:hypothetical protein